MTSLNTTSTLKPANGSDYLNLNQSPEELHKIHGERDYYHYLRSPQFIEGVVKPLANVVDGLGYECLDVGCGDACLADYLSVPYFGIDGSVSAVLRASKRLISNSTILPFAAHGQTVKDKSYVFYGRIEEVVNKLNKSVGTLIFCGIMEVLIKSDMRVKLIQEYASKFESRYVVICDLLRLDTTLLDGAFGSPITVMSLSCDPMGTDADDVKCFRKLLVYKI